MNTYNYIKEEPVSINRLQLEIEESVITIALDKINYTAPALAIIFKAELNADQIAILNDIVINHGGQPLPEDPKDVVVMKQMIAEGVNKRLKVMGYHFTAPAGQISTYDFYMPFDGCIQGGKIFTNNLQNLDEVTFTIFPGTEYEYIYIVDVPIIVGAEINVMEDFDTSSPLPEGIPLQVVYNNVGTSEVEVCFMLFYRVG